MTSLKKCMKKICATSLAVLMLGCSAVTVLPEVAQIGILASAAVDEGITDDGFEWYENYDGIITITGYTGEGGDVVIPDKIYGNAVTEIGEWAFYGCAGLASVSIPDSVTEIGQNAFEDCTGLTSVSIPDSVTEIAYGLFSGCIGLTSVDIPDSVTSIGGAAFCGCTGLTSVTIPDSVTDIWEDAFSGCTGLVSINIPNSVTLIDSYAFSGCTGLTNVSIPDGVTWIGSHAFEGCTGLTSVSIPDSVTLMRDNVFFRCMGLKSIEVSSDNENYSSDNGVLLDKTMTYLICCPSGFIGSYKIPITVTSIDSAAFSGCTGLTSVTIPDSVTYIGDSAFDGCIGLTSVTIPDGVTWLGKNAFYGCTGLTIISIPDSITSIGKFTFSGCTGLTRVTIPDSVTSIGYGAFEDCTGLTSVTIPDSVTEIGDNAFYGCTDLIIFGKVGSTAEEYANENGIPFVAVGNELSDTETNITVTGDIGKNIKLEVSELKPGDVQISGKKACAYYDISLTENGEKIQPNGNVAVKIPYKDGGENIEVYRINDDGTTEKMRSSYDGEYVTFITDHFSKYAIVADGGIKGDTNNDGEVNIADALMISRYDAGMVELEKSQLALSDVNGDGEVNIADALMISRFDAGLIDSL